LFDVLVQVGDKSAALDKAASWIGYWRKSGTHRTGVDNPLGRLVRMMLAADEPTARKLLCDAQRADGAGRVAQQAACGTLELYADGDPTGNTINRVEPREELGRRRRK
jgi:hypothetical protein